MPATVDPAELRPRVAEGVRFVPHRLPRRGAGSEPRATGPHYRVESGEGRYFDIGYSEYVVLSQWDGTSSLAESVSLAARHLRREALSIDEAATLLEWSGRSGLIDGVPAEAAADQKPLAKLNPFWLKLPLGRPDALLDWAQPLGRLLLSRLGLAAFALLIIAALVALPTRWATLSHSTSGILAPDNWISLLLVWIGLKAIHEFLHALAAKRFGTRVNEAGLIFILLAPCAYVDVTPSWSLRSRWQRIAIAAAGIAGEAAIAAVLILLWPAIGTEWGRQIAANALFTATVGSLLFNGNPLMRFDGYYILSDAIGEPNLATRGQAALQQTLRRILFGTRPARRQRESAFVHAYAWAAAAWKVVITVSLLAAAYSLAPGFGPPLVAIGASALVLPMLLRAGKTWRAAGTARRLRASLLIGLASAIGGGTLMLPWPGRVVAPGVVDDGPASSVRPASDGFVESVLVRDGDRVENGQPLLTLRNPEVEAEVRELTAELAQTILRADAARSRRELSAMQIEQRRRLAILGQLAIARQKADRLIVTAPQEGTLAAVGWDERLGTAVSDGDDLGRVVAGEQRVVASVPHSEIDAFRAAMRPASESATESRLVAVSAAGEVVPVCVVRLEPRASEQPADPLLTARYGGPLTIRLDSAESDEIITAEPTFALIVTLPTGTAWPSRWPVALQVRSTRTIGGTFWSWAVAKWDGLTGA